MSAVDDTFGMIYIFMQLGFSVSNWQKVQLNTDLLKHRPQYSYTSGKGWLKLNEIKKPLLKKQIELIWGEFN